MYTYIYLDLAILPTFWFLIGHLYISKSFTKVTFKCYGLSKLR